MSALRRIVRTPTPAGGVSNTNAGFGVGNELSLLSPVLAPSVLGGTNATYNFMPAVTDLGDLGLWLFRTVLVICVTMLVLPWVCRAAVLGAPQRYPWLGSALQVGRWLIGWLWG